ncbi:MAG: tetratricopeptide repeat protein, partial [Planctomycetes bacterium]|nr:tetratricopeptide repeat protein [Planctomycetota bacterium]
TYLKVLANLATAERELGHYPRAAELAQEAVEGKAAALGPSHDSTLQSMSMLADVLRQAGELERAIATFGACRDRARSAVPPQLANVYRCDLGEGRCHLARREFDAAERLLLACRDGFAAAEAQAAVKGQIVRPDADLLALYEAWGRPEQAARFRPAEPAAGAKQGR